MVTDEAISGEIVILEPEEKQPKVTNAVSTKRDIPQEEKDIRKEQIKWFLVSLVLLILVGVAYSIKHQHVIGTHWLLIVSGVFWAFGFIFWLDRSDGYDPPYRFVPPFFILSIVLSVAFFCFLVI